MKVTRLKRIRKQLKYFLLNFNLRPPYRILRTSRPSSHSRTDRVHWHSHRDSDTRRACPRISRCINPSLLHRTNVSNFPVEGAFLQAALENQVKVREQVPQMLQTDCRLYVTRCVLAELKAAGGFFSGAAQIASQFSIFTCSHGGGLLPGQQCMLAAVGASNSDHVIVAAQSFELREKVRKVPGVPMCVRIQYQI